MIYKLKNEVEKKILIDQHYHRVLIGVQGRKIKQFQKEFNVKVEFPNEGKCFIKYLIYAYKIN